MLDEAGTIFYGVVTDFFFVSLYLTLRRMPKLIDPQNSLIT